LLAEFKSKVAEAKERLAAQPPAPLPNLASGPSPPPSTKQPRTPSKENEETEEEVEEEEEDDDDDEEDYETYDDEEYGETIVTEERGTVFARKDGDPLGPWLALGVGYVKVYILEFVILPLTKNYILFKWFREKKLLICI